MRTLTTSICLKLQSLFFMSSSKEQSIERLFRLCNKYNTNLHLLDFNYENDSIEFIDSLYCQVISI